MKWKDAVIGGIVTLLVTTIAGVAIFYFTKEPDINKTESLFYTFGQSANFKGGTTSLGFNAINFGNEGGIPAKNVVISIRYENSDIKDYSIESPSGIKAKEVNILDKRAEFTFDEIVPAESVALSIITSSPDKPIISLRSSSSLGKFNEQLDKSKNEKKLPLILLNVMFFVQILLVVGYAYYRFKRKGYSITEDSSVNNIAFTFLHQGLIDEAHFLLNKSVENGEEGALVSSNLALCELIKGENQKADSLIKAADFILMFDTRKHHKAVVRFNQALISLHNANYELFLNKLSEAIQLSPKHILRYCNYSVHLESVRDDPRYMEVINRT